MPSPVVLTMRPWCSAIAESINSRRCDLSAVMVPISSAPIRRLYPTTSAARIAASRRCMAFPVNCLDRTILPAINRGDKREEAVNRRLNSLQLLQAARRRYFRWHRRIRKTGLPVGDADFADIDVAARVQRDAVRRQEFSGLEAGTVLAAEPRDALALGVDDGQARPEIWHLPIDRHAGAELADNEVRVVRPAAATQRAGPVQIIPLRLVFAVAVEYLHAMVLSIGHIDPAVGIVGDVVHDVELARIGAGLAPGLYQFAVGRVFVHAG